MAVPTRGTRAHVGCSLGIRGISSLRAYPHQRRRIATGPKALAMTRGGRRTANGRPYEVDGGACGMPIGHPWDFVASRLPSSEETDCHGPRGPRNDIGRAADGQWPSLREGRGRMWDTHWASVGFRRFALTLIRRDGLPRRPMASSQ